MKYSHEGSFFIPPRPDWSCEECRYQNFHQRDLCRRCGLPNPTPRQRELPPPPPPPPPRNVDASADRTSGHTIRPGYQSDRAGGHNGRTGGHTDRNVSHNVDFADNAPTRWSGDHHKAHANDWKCSQCEYINFGSRHSCRMCYECRKTDWNANTSTGAATCSRPASDRQSNLPPPDVAASASASAAKNDQSTERSKLALGSVSGKASAPKATDTGAIAETSSQQPPNLTSRPMDRPPHSPLRRKIVNESDSIEILSAVRPPQCSVPPNRRARKEDSSSCSRPGDRAPGSPNRRRIMKEDDISRSSSRWSRPEDRPPGSPTDLSHRRITKESDNSCSTSRAAIRPSRSPVRRRSGEKEGSDYYSWNQPEDKLPGSPFRRRIVKEVDNSCSSSRAAIRPSRSPIGRRCDDEDSYTWSRPKDSPPGSPIHRRIVKEDLGRPEDRPTDRHRRIREGERGEGTSHFLSRSKVRPLPSPVCFSTSVKEGSDNDHKRVEKEHDDDQLKSWIFQNLYKLPDFFERLQAKLDERRCHLRKTRLVQNEDLSSDKDEEDEEEEDRQEASRALECLKKQKLRKQEADRTAQLAMNKKLTALAGGYMTGSGDQAVHDVEEEEEEVEDNVPSQLGKRPRHSEEEEGSDLESQLLQKKCRREKAMVQRLDGRQEADREERATLGVGEVGVSSRTISTNSSVTTWTTTTTKRVVEITLDGDENDVQAARTKEKGKKGKASPAKDGSCVDLVCIDD